MIDSLEGAGQNVDFLRLRSEVLAKEWDKLNPKEQSQRIHRIKEATLAAAGGTDDLSISAEKATKATKKLGNQTTLLGRAFHKLNRAVGGLGKEIATAFSALPYRERQALKPS